MTKPSIEERLIALEEENRRLRELVTGDTRDLSSASVDRIFPVKTSAGTGTYPSSPANVFPIIFQDVIVDTQTSGDKTLQRLDLSAEPKRNAFSADFLSSGTVGFVIEHGEELLFLNTGGGSSVIAVAGRAKGVINPQATGEVDNLVLLNGEFTIADAAQVIDVFNGTTAFIAQDNAWVLAVQQNDGSWYMWNAECLGENGTGELQQKESALVDSGELDISKTPEVVISVTSENGKSLVEGVSYNVDAPNKKLTLIPSTYPGSGPVLYRGGHVEGELIEIVYTSKE